MVAAQAGTGDGLQVPHGRPAGHLLQLDERGWAEPRHAPPLRAPFTSYDIGWNRGSTVGEIVPLPYWHGDNTGWSGNERVTVKLSELRSTFPDSTEFRVGLKAFWYGERVAGYTRVTVAGCLNNNDVYYQPQLTTNAVGADHPGELVGELITRLDSNNNPTGFTIDTSGTDLGGNSEAPFCRQ